MTAAISGIGLPLSGLANHLFQTDPLTFHRHLWMAVHWSVGALFSVVAVWHAILNRRALLKHTQWAIGQISAPSREFVLALTLVSVPVFLFVIHAFIAD